MNPRKKKKKAGFDPQDKFFLLAKSKGYKSRAAFKLLEITETCHLFRPKQRVLDLGAAPGGWSQVALKAVGKPGLVVGIDLQAVTVEAPNYIFIEGDILEPATWAKLPEAERNFDVVLSDMAPSTTGIKFTDQSRSAELVEMAWQVAEQCLKPGGHFVAKLFPGETLGSIKKQLKRQFKQLKEMKPAATRKTSNELYLVALGYQP